MSTPVKRRRCLHRLAIKADSLLASVHANERPEWPNLADVESLSKRQWERKVWQLKSRLRELSLRAGQVLGQKMNRITLGPFNHKEATYATWLVQFFLFLPEHLQDGLLAMVRPKVRALVHFMCADLAGGELRVRHQRRGLRELG